MIKILFVCLGNICRSPSAEAVMTKLIADKDLAEHICCESAGIINIHEGKRADHRMRQHGIKRGYTYNSVSRPVNADDADKYDYIVTMDESNYVNVKAMLPKAATAHKIFPINQFFTRHHYREVPDPYYSDAKSFELVLDLLEDACENLLQKISQDHKKLL